ncbi:MAG: hypothetical protein AB7F64_08350 [Gammaproteobacteria bacterium]
MKKTIIMMTACISLVGCGTINFGGKYGTNDLESYTYPDPDYNYPDPAFVSSFYPDSYNSPYDYPMYMYSMPFAPDYYYSANNNRVYQEKVILPYTSKQHKEHHISKKKSNH